MSSRRSVKILDPSRALMAYLNVTGESFARFAARIGWREDELRQTLSAGATPPFAVARRIFLETAGAVRFVDEAPPDAAPIHDLAVERASAFQLDLVVLRRICIDLCKEYCIDVDRTVDVFAETVTHLFALLEPWTPRPSDRLQRALVLTLLEMQTETERRPTRIPASAASAASARYFQLAPQA